jgi:hypothetical protein
LAGVEHRSLCAIRDELREDGVPSPTGKPIWDIQAIRKLLKRDLYRPHSIEELRRAGVSEEVLRGLDPEGRCGLYYFGERRERRKRISEASPSEAGGRVYLLERYATLVREELERLPHQERHKVYKIVRLVVKLSPKGDLEMSGDLLPEPLSKNGTPYLPG